MVGWPVLSLACLLKVLFFTLVLRPLVTVKVFNTVGWPVLSSTCLLKVQKFRPPFKISDSAC